MERRPVLQSTRTKKPIIQRFSADPPWMRRLGNFALQNDLVDTNATLSALSAVQDCVRPNTVFIGIGLCSGQQPTQGIPFDILGMIVVAEQVRSLLGAKRLLVLLADKHALAAGVHEFDVERSVRRWIKTLRALRSAFGLDALQIVRGSELHANAEYQRLLETAYEQAPECDSDYFKREAADIAFIDRAYGGIVKVGWTIGIQQDEDPTHDETAFDKRFVGWFRRNIPFVYCKAGRVLDDRRPKASPYLLSDPTRRVCLHETEDPFNKLTQSWSFASQDTINGVTKHLKAICRNISQVGDRLQGDTPTRVSKILRRVFCSPEDHNCQSRADDATARALRAAFRR